MEIIRRQNEYYLYNERGVVGAHSNLGAKIAVDAVVNVNSGLMDAKRAMVLSYLHKAIKPLNQLRMVEDATVIYRLSRAPERRVFYVDVGNMPTIKAEQYLKDIMTKYRNKLVYDSSTGEIKDDRKHLSMLEDFWLPRREGSKGTEISTLPGGMNLGELEDVKYFEKKLYKSLSVPVSRLEQQQGFSLGRSSEITRDELKFNKFVQRLRNKFATLFDDLLRVQLVLKKICTEEEWKEFKEDVWYDFKKDNNFNELKEAELMTNRVGLLQLVDPYVGRYYSMEWVRKNVLQMTDEDILEIDEQMAKEQAAMPQVDPNAVDAMGNPIQPQMSTAQAAAQGGAPPMQQAPMPQAGGQQPMQEEQPQGPSKFELQPKELELM
jgi:Bacteriophage T4-like portal protein (Gp20)